MSRFSPIDLASYPISDVLDALSFEAALARDKADFLARWNALRIDNPALPPLDLQSLNLESEPINMLMQVGAVRETTLIARINDRVRSLTLAGAIGRALDHIGMTYYRTARRVITASINNAPAIMEDDETYRRRLALAPESWSTAGPEGAYLFWAVSASGDVLDVAVWSEDEGACLAPQVRVVVLSRNGNGAAPPALIDTVQTALNRRDIRPMCDLVSVESAVPLPFDVSVTLRIRPGASPALVTQAATDKIRAYCEGRIRWIGDDVSGPVFLIGRRIRQDTIAAAALVEGVEEVIVTSPATDVNIPHVDYEPSLPIVQNATTALSATIIEHLFKAPRLGSITITPEIMTGGWS